MIGDVQGCFDALTALLKNIDYSADRDRLYFCGDLVNRGGQSLEVLRWLRAHQDNAHTVLGNHDLSFLVQYHHAKHRRRNAELAAIMAAEDGKKLMKWLRRQPLMIELPQAIVVHAGLYPTWTMERARTQALELSEALRLDHKKTLKNMYGNRPARWRDDLRRKQRLRFTVNAFTRMRYLKNGDTLDLKRSGKPATVRKAMPWFKHQGVEKFGKHIYFGHWSVLGYYRDDHVTCLDTGKVWGGRLSAWCLESQKLHQI